MGHHEPRLKTLEEHEADIIRDYLIRHHYCKTHTAIALGIARSTLYKKMDQHNIKRNVYVTGDIG